MNDSSDGTFLAIDLSGRVVVFESLKKRKRGVFRAVPVPPGPLDMLDKVHGFRDSAAAWL